MAKTKQEIRTEVKQRRLALTPQERKEKSRCICAALLSLLDGTGPVMVYVAKPPEVDTELLITTLLARVSGSSFLSLSAKPLLSVFRTWTTLPCLSRARFVSRNRLAAKSRPGRMKSGLQSSRCLPLTGQGNRLGYGAGYYDRFLAAHPRVKTIGIAFACQEMPELPGEPTDIRMDRILTESGLIPVLENKDHEH